MITQEEFMLKLRRGQDTCIHIDDLLVLMWANGLKFEGDTQTVVIKCPKCDKTFGL